MYKPVLLVHHITEKLFQYPLDKFILTFDDGYVDHWEFFPRLRTISTTKIFFIICDWVNRPEFLSVEQIKHMAVDPNVVIGAHGFSHQDLSKMDIGKKISCIQEEIEKTCAWFQKNLGFSPEYLAFPFNDAVYGIYTQIAKDHGFKYFYGAERLEVTWLENNTLW